VEKKKLKAQGFWRRKEGTLKREKRERGERSEKK